MGRMRHGMAFRRLLRLLVGPMLVDRHVGDLAARKQAVWYRAWRVFQLVSRCLTYHRLLEQVLTSLQDE